MLSTNRIAKSIVLAMSRTILSQKSSRENTQNVLSERKLTFVHEAATKVA